MSNQSGGKDKDKPSKRRQNPGPSQSTEQQDDANDATLHDPHQPMNLDAYVPVPEPRPTRRQQEASGSMRGTNPLIRTRNAPSTLQPPSQQQSVQSQTAAEPMEVDDDGSEFDMASITESLPTTPVKKKKKTADGIPYDSDHPQNRNRLEIEAIIAKYFKKPKEVTQEELERLIPPIQEWHFSRYVKDKGGYSGTLNDLNKKRRLILTQTGLYVRQQTYQPLAREIIAEPSLARHVGTIKTIENIKGKKNPKMEPIPKPTTPKKNTKTSFYTAQSGYYDDDDLPKSPKSPKSPQSNKSTPERRLIVSAPAQSNFPTMPRTPPPKSTANNKSTVARLSFEDEQANKQVLLELSTKIPSFRECSSKCTVEEALLYFRELNTTVKDIPKSWVMNLSPNATLENMIPIIKAEHLQEMTRIHEAKLIPLIHGNNAFLLDGLIHLFLESCLKVFKDKKYYNFVNRPTKIVALLDIRDIMNAIILDLMKELKNGIHLPPLNLVAIPKAKRRSIKDIVTEDMIPLQLRETLFHDFVGKNLSDYWSAQVPYAITYKDALGFLPGNALNENTYAALLTKIKNNCLIGDTIFELIVWSELEKIWEIAPDLKQSKLDQCNEFIRLKEKCMQLKKDNDGHFDYVYIAVPYGETSYEQSMVLYTPAMKRLEIFLPQQPQNKAFWQWMQEDPDNRQMFGIRLQFVEGLLSKLKLAKSDEWLHAEISEPPVTTIQNTDGTVSESPTIQNAWPYNVASFIMSNKVAKCNSRKLDAIVCAVWFETRTNPPKFEEFADGTVPGKYKIYPDDKNNLRETDVRTHYFKELKNILK